MNTWNTNDSNIAINGYDPVSYFNGTPTQGQPSITCSYEGCTWQFCNEENKKQFESNPGQFVPQFGGYCSYGVFEGKTGDIDPNTWTITDNKLYLFSNSKNKNHWESNPACCNTANTNWSKGQCVAA